MWIHHNVRLTGCELSSWTRVEWAKCKTGNCENYHIKQFRLPCCELTMKICSIFYVIYSIDRQLCESRHICMNSARRSSSSTISDRPTGEWSGSDRISCRKEEENCAKKERRKNLLMNFPFSLHNFSRDKCHKQTFDIFVVSINWLARSAN